MYSDDEIKEIKYNKIYCKHSLRYDDLYWGRNKHIHSLVRLSDENIMGIISKNLNR